MSFEVVLADEINAIAEDHLLQHCRKGLTQEDLCFALWRPSSGQFRQTAIISKIILPGPDDRRLHGGASFESKYLSRALREARDTQMGLAFMHSHPGPGWQGMSSADIIAERDVIAYPAGETGLPLVGLTIGSDGYWSARFWQKNRGRMQQSWCEKIRVIGPQNYDIFYNNNLIPKTERREISKRTFDTWGTEAQNKISRLKIGIVGLGSIGCIVAEALSRIGVAQIVLVDPDRVERHNLDRLLYATIRDIGRLKVNVATRAIQRNSTCGRVQIRGTASFTSKCDSIQRDSGL